MLIETQYFPCIYFWSIALKTKELFIEKHENYQKRSYRNKCIILSVNNPLALTVPLSKGKNAKSPITDVLISNAENWREKHVQSIRSAYGSSPYFEFYWDDIEGLVRNKENKLYDYNMTILRYFAAMYKISIQETNEYEREPTKKDLRQYITPKMEVDIVRSYDQVFSEKHDFIPNLSILDLLFCKGPESIIYLKRIR